MSETLESFFVQEFANLKLNDLRLNRRAISIGSNLLKYPSSCIQEMAHSKNDARCTYDLASSS